MISAKEWTSPRRSKYSQYSYYDTPDGQDYSKKLFYLVRPALMWSSYIAIHDCLITTRPVGLVPIAVRFFQMWSRPVLTVTVFETTVYMATNIRKKDDAWNHVLGGITAAAYINTFARNSFMVYGWLLPSLVMLYYYKDYKVKYNIQYDTENYDGRETVCYSQYSSYNTWSWRKQFPREWLTEDEAKALRAKKQENAAA